MTSCSRCLLPDGVLDVTVGEEGTCNYCDFWTANGSGYTDYRSLEQVLQRRFDAVRGQHAYDALVGVSGGKDSTYVLYQLVTRYRLRVLAVTYDNGFLTDLARANVRRVVAALGVDHFFERPDWATHRSFYEGAFRRLGDPCVACAMSGYFLAIKLCHRLGIPYFVHGRSPFQMFRNLRDGTADVFIPMIALGLRDRDQGALLQLYRNIDRHVRGWLEQLVASPEARAAVYDAFFVDPAQLAPELVPEHLAYFLYHPYDEEQIKREIEREVGYQRPKDDALLGHGDCVIHDAAAHLYRRLRGVSPLAPEVAVMLRWNALAPTAATELLSGGDPSPSQLDASIAALCRSLDITRAEFHEVVAQLEARGVGRFASH